VADRLRGTGARDPVVAERSVAVLPFENLSLDPESRWFSDGMTEEVIARLARVPDLRVISRTSIMRYRDTDLGVDMIGRELGVATILEGSVRRDGDRVRISARLVDTRSTRSLWAESWDRALGDVFAIQSDLADRIAHSLGIALAGGDPRATPDLEAYDLYLRGRFFWNQRTGAGLGRAIELFEEALARDPTFAMAHAGLADAWVVMPYHTPTPAPPALEAALQAADRALDLNPDLGEAHAARAFALTGRWEWDAAEPEFRRALELSPGYATAHQWLALLLLARGDTANALAAIRRAHELDPLSRVIGYELGLVLFVTGRNDEALVTFDRVIELDPGFPTAHLHRAWVLDHVGRHEEAVEALERWNALLPAVAFSAGALQAALVDGGPAAAHRFLADLPPDVPVPTLDRAGWSLRAGRVDDAFAWLNRGLEAHETWFFLLGNSPATEPIREDPRFRELLRAMDLAPDTP
jgi:TolB-like protein